MSLDLRALLKKDPFSDVTVCCDGKKIYAHKAILSERCAVFAAMLTCDMAENATDVINIDDMDVEVVKAFLRYIYSGIVEGSVEVTLGLLYAADKYGLADLLKKSELNLSHRICTENAADFLRLSDLHHAYHLKTIVISFIRRNAKAVQLTESWKALEEADPKLIVATMFYEHAFTPDLGSLSNSATTFRSQVKVLKATFEWQIENYSFLSCEPGEYFESRRFACTNSDALEWMLRLYPRGTVNFPSHVGVFLRLIKSPVRIVRAKTALSMTKRRIERYFINHDYEVTPHRYDLGGTKAESTRWWETFVSIRDLHDKERGHLPNDTFELSCKIIATLNGELVHK